MWILLSLILQSGLAFATVNCDWLVKKATPENEGYELNRDLVQYEDVFTPDKRKPRVGLSASLKTDPGGVIVDIGLGRGQVLRELARRVSPATQLLGVALAQPNDPELAADLAAHPNFIYLSEQSFETRFAQSSLDAYKGKATRVIDVFGAGTYGCNPFQTV